MTGRDAAGGLRDAIAAAAARAALPLGAPAVARLAAHASRVLEANPLLHLTTITAPDELAERHVVESLRGAALVPEGARGVLLDLGSGNGYPGIPIAVVRPGLAPVLAEASAKKAGFLREALQAAALPTGRVLERHVDRGSDLDDVGPVRVVVTRAMGGWERVLPKLHAALEPGSSILVWGGATVEDVRTRAAWRRFVLREKVALPGREASWIWSFSLSPT